MPRTATVTFTFPIAPDQHAPSTVQVTGVFDDWQKSESGFLTKNESHRHFEGTVAVDLDRLQEVTLEGKDDHKKKMKRRKLVYKFVLDGHQWVTDPACETEWDYSGNQNSIRFIDDLTFAKGSKKDKMAAAAVPMADQIMMSASASASTESVNSAASEPSMVHPTSSKPTPTPTPAASGVEKNDAPKSTSDASSTHSANHKTGGKKKKSKGRGV
ncbi:hypothetical protein B0O80DRAFT_458359 [Mortierella sp. GBAus27b]|nr:hypothetical protein BGX31_000486 [Mortierella sp. GBA43]KAI8350217.1 hypothetical protein B0O80DRAFT_458359 [Mortierella sp. GBAus27b]